MGTGIQWTECVIAVFITPLNRIDCLMIHLDGKLGSPASQCDRFNVRSVGCPRATGSEQSLSQEINKDIQLDRRETPALAGSTAK